MSDVIIDKTKDYITTSQIFKKEIIFDVNRLPETTKMIETNELNIIEIKKDSRIINYDMCPLKPRTLTIWE